MTVCLRLFCVHEYTRNYVNACILTYVDVAVKAYALQNTQRAEN